MPGSRFKSLNLFQLCPKFVVFISTSPSPQNFPYSGSGHQTNCGHLFSWPKRILNSVALKPSIVNWAIEVAGSNISPSFSHASKQQIQLQIQNKYSCKLNITTPENSNTNLDENESAIKTLCLIFLYDLI